MFLRDLREGSSVLAWGFCDKGHKLGVSKGTHIHRCTVTQALSPMWLSVGEVKVGRANLELASPLEAPEATQLSDACWTSMRNRVPWVPGTQGNQGETTGGERRIPG